MFCCFFFKPLRQQVQGGAFSLRAFSQDSRVHQSDPLVLHEHWPFKRRTNSGSNSKSQLEVQAAILIHMSCPESCPSLELTSSSNPSHANTNSSFFYTLKFQSLHPEKEIESQVSGTPGFFSLTSQLARGSGSCSRLGLPNTMPARILL